MDTTSEFKAVLDLLAMLVLDPRTGVLIAALVVAAWSDVKTGRIPNELVYSGIAVALAYSGLAPVRGADLLSALGGLGIGLVLLLPLYLMRAMGAGDVKLMAMAGAFLGFPDALTALLASFLAGGVLSLVVALRKRSLRLALTNLALMVRGAARRGLRLDAADTALTAGRMPYGVAIAAGTIGYLVLRQLGFIS